MLDVKMRDRQHKGELALAGPKQLRAFICCIIYIMLNNNTQRNPTKAGLLWLNACISRGFIAARFGFTNHFTIDDNLDG